jgi:methionyl-tRNA formyltransferase
LRTVYLGTSEFAATVLARLAQGPHRPALVISRPDRPSGRGRKLTAPPVATAARELGLPLEQPERVNEPAVLDAIERAAPGEVVPIVCAFGALIKEPLLAAHPLLNVHPSLLPRWRGAAPIERAIMAGDGETGVSIMRLTAGLDSGPVCRVASVTIAPEDTYGTLAPRLAALGGELLVGVLEEWERGRPPAFLEQDDARASYAEKIGPEDRQLDPARGALELERVVRALHPHIGARLTLPDGSTLGVLRARAAAAVVSLPASAAPPAGALTEPAGNAAPPADAPAPGILTDAEGRLVYGTCDGALELLEVQPPGGRAMDARAYLRGHALPRP